MAGKLCISHNTGTAIYAWNQGLASYLAKFCGVVCLGDFNVSGMIANLKLARRSRIRLVRIS